MPRMTIYINDELKSAMDARPEFNWSFVAQKAFENVIAGVDAQSFALPCSTADELREMLSRIEQQVVNDIVEAVAKRMA